MWLDPGRPRGNRGPVAVQSIVIDLLFTKFGGEIVGELLRCTFLHHGQTNMVNKIYGFTMIFRISGFCITQYTFRNPKSMGKPKNRKHACNYANISTHSLATHYSLRTTHTPLLSTFCYSFTSSSSSYFSSSSSSLSSSSPSSPSPSSGSINVSCN